MAKEVVPSGCCSIIAVYAYIDINELVLKHLFKFDYVELY